MIFLEHFDESWIKIDFDEENEFKILNTKFSYVEPSAKFSFAFKMGNWSGHTYLLHNSSKGCFAPAGLLTQIIKLCLDKKLKFDVDKNLCQYLEKQYSVEEIYDYLKPLKFYSKRQEILPRKDQYGSVIRICSKFRGINIAPTGWGKSLAIFMQILFLLNVVKLEKILLIVPTKDLVQQFKNDILDYCTNEKGKRTELFPNIQMLFSGQDKNLANNTQLFISTFQSLNKLDKNFGNSFDVILVDEVHRASNNSIKKVLQSADLVKYKYGWTGSLPDESINKILAEANIGPSKIITTSKCLIEESVLADVEVQRIKIIHQVKPVELKKDDGETYLKSFQKENDYFELMNDRNKYICNFLEKLNQNTLVFFNHLKHGDVLYKLSRELYPERKVFLITGEETTYNDQKYKNFEDLKPIIEKNNDCILIVSQKRFSTGINLHNIHNLIFTTSGKSAIQVIQSIGRGLRRGINKKKLIIWDFFDVFKKSNSTFSKKHAEERLNIYKNITKNINEVEILF